MREAEPFEVRKRKWDSERPAELERVDHSRHNREVNWFLWARVVNNRAVILDRDDRRPDVINTFVRAAPPGG